MKELRAAAITATLLASMSMPYAASAYDKGDMVLRVGAAQVDARSSSDSLAAIPGATVDVEDDTSIGITFTYMLSDEFGLGVLAATPFHHDIEGDGVISALGTIAETKQLPPTVTLQYHFEGTKKFHPYVGAGINYTNFFSEDTKGALSASRISLDDSWGLALEAGMDFEIGNGWLLSGQVWWIDIDTEAKLSGGILPAQEKIDVEIDPVVYMVSIGKRF